MSYLLHSGPRGHRQDDSARQNQEHERSGGRGGRHHLTNRSHLLPPVQIDPGDPQGRRPLQNGGQHAGLTDHRHPWPRVLLQPPLPRLRPVRFRHSRYRLDAWLGTADSRKHRLAHHEEDALSHSGQQNR